MKNKIHKFNQYLLENYPTIWNTKLVWMLLISLCIHVFFFILGYFTIIDVEMLHERNAVHLFFSNGTVFFSIIISILQIVIWLVYLFKNNSFKNFYPTSRTKLFFQFLCYLVIIFMSITYYISHGFGLRAYINNTYPKEKVEKEIRLTNKSALFFSHSVEYYTLDNLSYPSPFDTIYCETRDYAIDTSKTYLKWLDDKYQFYTLKAEKIEIIDRESGRSKYVFERTIDTTKIYFYKDSLIDILKYKKSVEPSYFNYSKTFYKYNDMQSDYTVTAEGYNQYKNDESKLGVNKQVNELLTRNNRQEIKSLLANFLKLTKKYKIKTNIDADTWLGLVYHPEGFYIKSFIRPEPKDKLNYTPAELYVDENDEYYKSMAPKEKFYIDHATDYYIETSDLHNVFQNIDDVRDNRDELTASLHVFIWISFVLSILIFMFRVTSLQAFLFTVISAGLLAILVLLLSVLYRYSYGRSSISSEDLMSILTIIIGFIILLISILFTDKFKKTIVAVLINISLIGFVLYLLLIVAVVSSIQRGICSDEPYYVGKKCFVLINYLGENLSWILFAIGILFVFFYTTTIKKWKGLPEG